MGLNIADQLEFYGSYHHNKWNKLVHFIFVPVLVFTALIVFCYTGSLIEAEPLLDILPFNGAFFVFCLYATIYFCIDVTGAITGNALLLSCLITANILHNNFPENAWKYALILHALSWAAQILAHKFFEGRAPALMDSFFQSLVLAPLFVSIEIGFIFGLRESLRKELEIRITRNIRDYRKARSKLM